MTDPLYQFLHRRKIVNGNDSAPPEVQFDRWMCDRIDEAIEEDRKRRHFPPDAEAERLRADKARLDWLEEHEAAYVEDAFGRGLIDDGDGDGLRSCLDAAITAPKEAERD